MSSNKPKQIISVLITFMILMIPKIALANSSWMWVTCRPFDLLPFVAIMTITIEYFIIKVLGKVSKWLKTLVTIFISNIASFLIVLIFSVKTGFYGFAYVDRELDFFAFHKISSFDRVSSTPDFWYLSSQGIFYLILTLLIEVPIVFFILKKDCSNRKRLLGFTILANILTTFLVFLLEITLCYGMMGP